MDKGFGKYSEGISNKSKKFLHKKLIERAFFAQKNNNLEEAKNIYQELYELNIKNPLIYFNYGSILEKTNNYNKANEVYLKAINNFPNDPNFHKKQPFICKNKGTINKLRSYSKTIEIDKNFENGYINLANIHIDLKNHKKARKIDKF